MADIDFDEFEDPGDHAPWTHGYGRFPRPDPCDEPAEPPLSARFQRLFNGAGAVTSVALIFGLGVWGYRLAVRDVTGIPVIRALEGPARVAPAEPGGELALYQGMAVNAVQAEGIAAAPDDSMTLAPKAAGLADEDQPMGAPLPAATAAPAARIAPAALRDAKAAPSGVSPARMTAPLPDGPIDTVQDATDADASDTPDTPAGVAPATAIAADIPGVARSPRPMARPAGDAMAEAAAAAVAAAFAPAGALDIAPEDLAPGTRLVQIGTFADAGTARAEWDLAAGRFGALLDGKRRVIEPAERSGSTFYRLRVEGFADIADARRFCDVLTADGAECVPAQVR